RKDLEVRRPVRDRPARGAGHACAVVEHQPADADGAPDAEHDAPVEQSAQEAEKAAGRASAPVGAAPRPLGLGWLPTSPAATHAARHTIARANVDIIVVASCRSLEGRLDALGFAVTCHKLLDMPSETSLSVGL